MKTFVLKSIKEVVRNWYLPLLVGLFFVIVSIVVFASPASSLLALSLLFAFPLLFNHHFP